MKKKKKKKVNRNKLMGAKKEVWAESKVLVLHHFLSHRS